LAVPAHVWRGAVAGAIGGLIGAVVMERFQSFWSWAAAQLKPKRVAHAGSEPATVKTADRLSEIVLGKPLPDDAKAPSGEAVHYSMGIATGMIYGVLADRFPVTTRGIGLPFGTLVSLSVVWIGLWRLRLAKIPTSYSVSVHLYALASHLVYGATTEVVRRGVRTLLGGSGGRTKWHDHG